MCAHCLPLVRGKLVETLRTVARWKGVNVMCPGLGCSPLKDQYSGSELIADWKVLDLIMIFLLEKILGQLSIFNSGVQ